MSIAYLVVIMIQLAIIIYQDRRIGRERIGMLRARACLFKLVVMAPEQLAATVVECRIRANLEYESNDGRINPDGAFNIINDVISKVE